MLRAQPDVQIEDDGAGNLTIRCKRGKLMERANKHGMFCSDNNCACEQEARAVITRLVLFFKLVGAIVLIIYLTLKRMAGFRQFK